MRVEISWNMFNEDLVVVPNEMQMGIFGENDGPAANGLVVERGYVGVTWGADEPEPG